MTAMARPGVVDGIAEAGVVRIVADAFGADTVEVQRIDHLSAGASRLSFAIDVLVDGERHELVLQRERVRGRSDVAAEARLLSAAGRVGVPVPRVIAADAIGSAVGGAFILTTRIAGETLPGRILRAPDLATVRAGFAERCGEILAAISSIPVEAVAPLPATDPLDAVTSLLDASPDPRPVLELGLVWLRQHRPLSDEPRVVHGDFRNGNFIVSPNGIEAVLDWELAHIGDPLEDLGWLCCRAWRFGGPGVVGGIGSRAELVRSYERATGRTVSLESLLWWQILATVRWGAICLEQARTHLSGEHRSVELAVIGRRACEMEYDLLRMLP